MLEGWEEVADEALAPIEEIVASSTSYEEAMARLAEALPQMGGARLIEALVKGSFRARALGDIQDG